MSGPELIPPGLTVEHRVSRPHPPDFCFALTYSMTPDSNRPRGNVDQSDRNQKMGIRREGGGPGNISGSRRVEALSYRARIFSTLFQTDGEWHFLLMGMLSASDAPTSSHSEGGDNCTHASLLS